MLSRAESIKKLDINPDVSEYIWDLKTRRFKRNPYYRPDRIATQYIWGGIIILIILITIVWCLK